MKVYVLGMEKKDSFCECPKCGLRNKPTAVQCDFCGHSLNNDAWESHVKDLESLTRVDVSNPMDDRVFRRIESTIIRKDAAHKKGEVVKEIGKLEEILKDIDQPPNENVSGGAQKHQEVERSEEKVDLTSVIESKEPITTTVEPAGVAEVDAPEKIILEEPKEVEKEDISSTESASPIESSNIPTEETVVIPEPPKDAEKSQPEPVAVEPSVVKDPEITVSTDTSASIIKLKLVQVVEEPKPTNDPPVVRKVHRSWSKPSGSVAMAILALGMALYIFVLVLTALGTLDTLFGLIGGAIASLITIYGATVTYHSLRNKDREEVYICPKCHETVDKRGDKCPSCGASFRSED